MNILEEYLARHNRMDLPVAHHCTRSFFIARQSIVTCGSGFLMLDVMWVTRTRGPGYYSVSTISPHKPSLNWRSFLRHMDSFSRSTLTRTMSTSAVEYDEYEDFMEDWFRNLKHQECSWKGASDRDSCLFMLWEVFVYIFDNLFAESPFLVRSDLWDSLNEERSHEERKESIGKVVSYVDRMSGSASDFWLTDLIMFSKRYAPWMGRLFDNTKPKEVCHVG